KHEIGLECVQNERRCNAENNEACADPREAFVPRLHACYAIPVGSSDERVVTGISGWASFASTSVRRRRARSITISTTMTSAVTPYAVQTYQPYPPITKNVLIR